MNDFTAEDWTIIRRFQGGDQSAFDDLQRRHLRRANHHAFQLTKDRDEAADVVANTFCRAFQSLNKFKGESSFASWLYRIETNCFLDMRKKARSRPTVSLNDIINDDYSRAQMQANRRQSTAQENLEMNERLAAITRVIENLPASQKITLLMFQADSMSYEAIADALCLPIGTVKSRINRARFRVREFLVPHNTLF